MREIISKLPRYSELCICDFFTWCVRQNPGKCVQFTLEKNDGSNCLLTLAIEPLFFVSIYTLAFPSLYKTYTLATVNRAEHLRRIYRVSHKRRPIAKILKVDILHYFTFLIITE